MIDHLGPTTQARSKNMAAIRSRGNVSTELRMMKILRLNKLTGWRRNTPVFGKPDFVWKIGQVALFVDGCFWHGCPKCRRKPINNAEYWEFKIIRNQRRDREVTAYLNNNGWNVIRIWECQIASPITVRRLKRILTKP